MKENFKNMKAADEELIKALVQDVSDKANTERDILEEYEFSFKGVKYALSNLGGDEWEDDGKYQNKFSTYQLISFDDSETSYPCSANFLDSYDVTIGMGVSRTGSYYSDYYYDYYEPEFHKIKKVMIPEVVIPEHEDIEYLEIK